MHESLTKDQSRFRLTHSHFVLDDCDAWTLNASLTRLSSYRKCSKRRILGHSAQATSLLPIEGTTKCLRIARGSDCGSASAFAAEVKPKAGLGFKASAASPVLKPRILEASADREKQSMYQLETSLSIRPAKKEDHLGRKNSHGS